MNRVIMRSGPGKKSTARRRVARGMVCGLLWIGVVLVDLSCAGGGGKAVGTEADTLRRELREVIQAAKEKVYPALVHIQLVTSNYYGGKEIKGQSVGSGTIITAEGHILTNQHVVDKGRRFRCTLSDKQEIAAELVGEDALTDLAVLKLDLSELKDPNQALPVASFGDSSNLQIGDLVLAMGSPFALSRAVTMGIVSNTERVFAGGMSGGSEELHLGRWQRTGLFTVWIQHDAQINPGNSGGPLVNLAGEVIGVNELGGSGMGFAIPSSLARQVARTLIAQGEVDRSWIGVSFRALEKTGLTEGVIVDSVVADSPAHAAGLTPGDVIVKIDDRPVTVRFPEELPALLKRLADAKIGAKIKIAYKRDDKTQETTISTAKLEKDRGDEVAFRAWGFTAMEITPMIAREYRLDSPAGVLVTGVRPGGNAALAKPALESSDIIRSVDGQPVNTLAELVERYKKIMDTDPLPEYVMIEFERKQTNNFTLVEPKPEEDQPPPREVPKAWIGVAVQPVLTDLAERLQIKDSLGFRVTQVYPRTNAATCDLKVGDVITHLNGKRIKPRRVEDTALFYNEVKRLEIDDQATLTVLRGDKTQDVAVTLERSRIQPDEAEKEQNRDFEMTVREVTFFDRVDNRWDEQVTGLIVSQVESAGWAGLGGVRHGDLIQKIDELAITDLESFRKAMQTITERKPPRIVFFALRGARTRFLYVEPEWSPEYKEKEKKHDQTQQ